MELTAVLIGLPVAYVIVMVTRWAVRRHFRHQILDRCGIPGPKPDFFGGNMFHVRKRPPNEAITEWLKQYGSVFGYFVGEVPTVMISDLEILKQIMIKDFHVFSNRQPMFLDISPLNRTLMALRDTRWKEVRSILTPTFSSGKIKLMTSIIEKKVDVTVSIVEDHAKKGEMFDIYELIQGLTLDVIADCAFAMKTDCQTNLEDMFLVAVRDFFRFSQNAAVVGAIIFPFVASVMTFICKYMTSGQMTELVVQQVKRAIAERRKTPQLKSVDILQLMIDHGDDVEGNVRGMTDEEIIANAYLFLLAGYETTATALAFTFYLLIKHPEIQDKLFQEIDAAEDCSYNTVQNLQFLDQVFSESMRMYPPVTGFVARHCDRDYEVGDFTIPKGAVVQAAVWDIHHDPEHWPEPWTFQPERFSPENKKTHHSLAYLPFGAGRRNCVGARFALLEAKMAIFRLVKKFRFEKCERTEDPITLICPTVIINPAKGVFVMAVPRDEQQ